MNMFKYEAKDQIHSKCKLRSEYIRHIIEYRNNIRAQNASDPSISGLNSKITSLIPRHTYSLEDHTRISQQKNYPNLEQHNTFQINLTHRNNKRTQTTDNHNNTYLNTSPSGNKTKQKQELHMALQSEHRFQRSQVYTRWDCLATTDASKSRSTYILTVRCSFLQVFCFGSVRSGRTDPQHDYKAATTTTGPDPTHAPTDVSLCCMYSQCHTSRSELQVQQVLWMVAHEMFRTLKSTHDRIK